MRTKAICIFIFTLLMQTSMAMAGTSIITINTDGRATAVESASVVVSLGETGKAFFGSEDFQYLSKSGEPQIPWKVMMVLLSPDADMATISCSIVSAEYETIEGVWAVAPAPPILTRDADGNEIEIWPSGKTIVDGCDTDIYSADVLWPSEAVQLTGMGRLRSWRLAEIAMPLVRYNPVSGELQRLVQAVISVDCDKKGKAITRGVFMRNTATGKRRGHDRVRKLAVNFDDAVVVYEAAEDGTESIQKNAPASDDAIMPLSLGGTNGYVVITTNAIRNASTKLADFVAHKQSMGFTVTVIDEDDTGATTTGDAAATKLREWLQANYESMDLKYALIIGDPRPGAGYSRVPMKMYPCEGRYIPTDYFYAELTCDWDKDSDGIIGERGAAATSGDEIERYFEVYVGRIPHYGVMANTDAILQKTIDYENATNAYWRRNTLITVVPASINLHFYDWGEQVKSDILEPKAIPSDRLYRNKYGHTITDYDIVPPPSAYPTTVWSQGQYGLHIWSTHGGPTIASSIMYSSGAANLNDNYPSAFWQGSCQNAWPEITGNLSYSILKNGGIVTLGATRNSYYVSETDFSNSPSDCGMGYRYAKGISEGKSCGEALWDLKEETSSWWIHNWTLFNPYGDPSVVVMSDAPVFTISPTDCFYAKHLEGETGFLAHCTFTLNNNGDSPLNWTANKTESWFDISASSGSIPAGTSTTIKVSLNLRVASFTLGTTHSDTITFTDTTNNITLLRDVKCVIRAAGPPEVPQSAMSLHYVDSEASNGVATKAFDGNTATYWHTEYNPSDPPHPHEMQINLGGRCKVNGFRYLPRQSGGSNGKIKEYEFYVSTDGFNWGSAVATGTFENTAEEQEALFAPVNACYVRLVALSEVNGGPWTSVAELNVGISRTPSFINDPLTVMNALEGYSYLDSIVGSAIAYYDGAVSYSKTCYEAIPQVQNNFF